MSQIGMVVGIYDNNPSLFALLYRFHGYQLNGSIDYQALQIKKAGYGEPTQVVEINEQLFAANNVRWYEPHLPETIRTWQQDEQSHQLMSTYLQQLPTNTFITDARLSFTLPFWQSALVNTGHELFVIVPYNHPFTWAHHMHQKRHMSTRLSLALWSTYTLSIIYHTQSVPHFFVHTPSLYEHWQSACQPLIDRLTPNGISPSVITHLNSHVEHLRNKQQQTPHPSAVIEQMAIYNIANDIYTALNQSNLKQTTLDDLQQRLISELSNPDYTHDIAQFDVLYHDQFLDIEGRIRTLNQKHNQAQREKQEQIRVFHQQKQEQIRALHQQKQEQIRALHQQKQEQIHAIYQQLNDQMHKMQEQHDVQIADFHAKIANLKQSIADMTVQHEHQRTDMHNSFSNEISYLNEKITTMKSEIDWRTDIIEQQQILINQQQEIINQLKWVIGIVNFLRRIKTLGRKRT